MPRPRTKLFYQELVASYTEQGYGPGEIFKLLQNDAQKAGDPKSPSDRTIRRIREEHFKKNPMQRRDYALFVWPESMEEANIPWEASPVVLKLMKDCEESGQGWPTVGFLKWLWRVYITAPDMDEESRDVAATWLILREHHKTRDTETAARGVQSYLAYGLWMWKRGGGQEPQQEYASQLRKAFAAAHVNPGWVFEERSLPLGGLEEFLYIIFREKGIDAPDFSSEWIGDTEYAGNQEVATRLV